MSAHNYYMHTHTGMRASYPHADVSTRVNMCVALPCSLQCLTVPVAAMSAIQVEAHRKFVLVSLINKGTVEVVPKAVNGKLAAALMSLDASYTNLGKLVTEALDKSRYETCL